MKILIVGAWYAHIYEEAFYNGFVNLNYDVYKFSTSKYFDNFIGDNRLRHKKGNKFIEIFKKLENKFSFGPDVREINNGLLKEVRKIEPHLIFFFRCANIYPSTLRIIKSEGKAVLFAYNNDDPFSDKFPFYYWRHFLKGLKYFDHIFSYRLKNIVDYRKIGFSNVSLLRSYYIESQNYLIPETERIYDVVFIGHYENDGRDEAIKYLLDNGIRIRLFGTLWHKSKYYSQFLKYFNTIAPLYKEEYNLTLNQSKIALVFFSKINNDTYTRRCFEIPITKALMLSEYSNDINILFEMGKDADYFYTKEELLKKINYYLENPVELTFVAENGFNKLVASGHEVKHRCVEIIKSYRRIDKTT